MNATKVALSGRQTFNGPTEKALTTNFDLLNLVPLNSLNPLRSSYSHETYDKTSFSFHNKISDSGRRRVEQKPMKWRRVGLVAGKDVHLDTIVWPGGNIVVSGKKKCCHVHPFCFSIKIRITNKTTKTRFILEKAYLHEHVRYFEL